jgi:fructose-specific phosphotransferase system component IIB
MTIMDKTIIGILALIVGVVIGAMGMTVKDNALGGVTVENETFKGNVTVEGTLTSSDVTVADDLTVTEDIIMSDETFCVNFFATSTATQIKMVASTTLASGSNIGVMTMQYGSCRE